MKIFIYTSIIVLVLLLGGCAEKEAELPVERKPVTEETIAPAEVHTEEYSEPVMESDRKTTTDNNKEDGWLTYAEKYDTEYRFTDLYLPAKCWLIGNENIVEIISLGDIDNVTVITQSSVERVEHSTVMNFCNVTVFDKTGKSISIMLLSEDAEKLLGLIK